MSLRIAATAAIFVLAVTTLFAQETAPANPGMQVPAAAPQATTPHPLTPMNRWPNSATGRRQAGPVNPPSLEQRVQDLAATVDQMHVVLKKMHTKAAATAKDPAVKANLEMWDLMVGQLDKQLQELKQAEVARQDMEARRAAMYKQADIKSQAEAKAAQQARFPQQANGNNGPQSAVQGSAAPAPAASQTPAGSTAPSTPTSPKN
jgi:hypothetical protein